MVRFWFTMAAMVLMLLYTAVLGALATHVQGFDLPPIAAYFLSVLAPVILVAANAIDNVFKSYPGSTGDIQVPKPEPGLPVVLTANASGAVTGTTVTASTDPKS